jgi:HD-GYP domain-containing protein (c-di-GMP phosphodiesterase class II)
VYVRHHHERHDGRGYPDGLRGGEIPVPSRMVAVADAYDAMVRPRPYRTVDGLAYAAREFRRHAGRQWDPAVIHALFACVPELRTAKAG